MKTVDVAGSYPFWEFTNTFPSAAERFPNLCLQFSSISGGYRSDFIDTSANSSGVRIPLTISAKLTHPFRKTEKLKEKKEYFCVFIRFITVFHCFTSFPRFSRRFLNRFWAKIGLKAPKSSISATIWTTNRFKISE